VTICGRPWQPREAVIDSGENRLDITVKSGPGSRSALERALGVFTEVRRGEGATVLALAVNIFLILMAYYLIKPVREALILSVPGGAELKSYAAAGQAILLLLLVPTYGWLASRVPRMKLIDSVTLFFSACLGVFYLLIMAGVPVALAFFLWVGVFNLMVPAQFWAFANDLYSPEQGKRLFVMVAFGASSGAVFGSFVADEMIRYVGVYEMLLAAGGLLATTLLVTHWVAGRARQEPARGAPAREVREEPLGKGNAFGLVFRNRYLLLLAFMLLFNNWVNANGEYILGRIVKEAADAASAAPGHVSEDAFIAGFYARYFGTVNLVGMLLQLFVVSRVIKYVGVPVAVCLLPAITMGSYGLIVALPVLGVVRWVKTAENSTDYSLQNTIKQVLYLPTTRAEKYKAKQAIDTFFVRAGDLCSAGLVLAGTHVLGFGVRDFAIVTIVLGLVWLLISVRLGQRFKALVPARPGEAK
jgi:AAA family ATP:ADP antiporter